MPTIVKTLLLTVLLCYPPCQLIAAEIGNEEFRLGIFPRRTAAVTEKMFTPLVNRLETRLGTKVTLETTHDFATFWERVASKRYDIVHYNQYHYVRSHKDFGYEVIAHNVEFGHDQIAGAILVRKDSDIRTLADLKGKKIVFGGGRRAMQAYIATTYLLRQAGLKKGDYFEKFALTPPKASIATYYHQASAAGAGNYVLELPAIQKQINISEMRYLAISDKWAHLPWAVAPGMNRELKEKIRRLLVTLHETKGGRRILNSAKLTRLKPASDKDFDPHRKIIKSVLNEDL